MQPKSNPQNWPKPIPPKTVISFLSALCDLGFSGKIAWKNSANIEWICFYTSGKLVFATGGQKRQKRWRRNVLQHRPQTTTSSTEAEYETRAELSLSDCAEIQQLKQWILDEEIDLKQALKISSGLTQESLMELIRSEELACQIIPENNQASEIDGAVIPLINTFEAFQKTWEGWERLDLGKSHPDQIPIIIKKEQIQEKTNRQLYQLLMVLLDGRNTLWDVAAKTNQGIVEITQALRSFTNLGWIELVDTPVILQPAKAVAAPEKSSPPTAADAEHVPIIACVDDSEMVCRSMAKIIKSKGYKFVPVLDAKRAISTLLVNKPDIIFLDLVMPHTNGYEICSQLRKVSRFSEVPIIILSGNDGVVDQVRARLMGATDFVSKPVDVQIILSHLEQHLQKIDLLYQKT